MRKERVAGLNAPEVHAISVGNLIFMLFTCPLLSSGMHRVGSCHSSYPTFVALGFCSLVILFLPFVFLFSSFVNGKCSASFYSPPVFSWNFSCLVEYTVSFLDNFVWMCAHVAVSAAITLLLCHGTVVFTQALRS